MKPLHYPMKVRANVTEAMHEDVDREAALTAGTRSDVIRAALALYFRTSEKRRRAS